MLHDLRLKDHPDPKHRVVPASGTTRLVRLERELETIRTFISHFGRELAFPVVANRDPLRIFVDHDASYAVLDLLAGLTWCAGDFNAKRSGEVSLRGRY